MIARLRVLLPFYLSLRADETLHPQEFVHEEYRGKLYPPLQSNWNFRDVVGITTTPLNVVADNLQPKNPPSLSESIRIDDKPAVQTNLLQLDFFKQDFDRHHLGAQTPEYFEDSGDPPMKLCFNILNSFLDRVRTLTRGSHIRSISAGSTIWKLQYLNDDESELNAEEGKFRARVGIHFTFSVTGITESVWRQAQGLPLFFDPPVWDTLLLDAEALLPERGAAIVLAFASLETFIFWALNELVQRSGINPSLWEWINNRENWLKEPSITEQYDKLLRIMTDKSLKDKQALWEAFRNLKEIRDAFVHAGELKLGGKLLTREDCYKLMGLAKEIVDYVESLLPRELRRPKLETPSNVTMTKPLFGSGG